MKVKFITCLLLLASLLLRNAYAQVSPSGASTNPSPQTGTPSAMSTNRSLQATTPATIPASVLPQTHKEGVVTIDGQTQTVYKLPDFFTYTFTAITVLVSVVTIVLGGLLALNFISARDVVKKAEAELQTLISVRTDCEKAVGELKRSFATYLDAKTKELVAQANEDVKKAISNHYEAVVIPKIKGMSLG